MNRIKLVLWKSGWMTAVRKEGSEEKLIHYIVNTIMMLDRSGVSLLPSPFQLFVPGDK